MYSESPSDPYCNRCFGGDFGCVECATKELRAETLRLRSELAKVEGERDRLRKALDEARDYCLNIDLPGDTACEQAARVIDEALNPKDEPQ